MEQKLVTGNYFDKYHTGNVLYRKLMLNFHKRVLSLIPNQSGLRVLEVGCGEGYLARVLEQHIPGLQYTGIEIDAALVDEAKAAMPQHQFHVGSAYDLSAYRTNNYDCIVVSEVLEHLQEPGICLSEIRHLSAGCILLTVPWEPVWRILNICRLSYLSEWGNTPGHLQHWNRKKFRALVDSYFRVNALSLAFPWIVCAAVHRQARP